MRCGVSTDHIATASLQCSGGQPAQGRTVPPTLRRTFHDVARSLVSSPTALCWPAPVHTRLNQNPAAAVVAVRAAVYLLHVKSVVSRGTRAPQQPPTDDQLITRQHAYKCRHNLAAGVSSIGDD